VGSLLEVGTGFHPELTGRENTYLNGAILGMRRQEIDRKFDDIINFAGIEKFIDTPVKRYSSGMQVRLAFAVAAHLEPDILLIDEVLAVGDAEFQKKCMGRMELVSGEGRTVLFVSHSMQAVLRLCPRVILLDRGGVVADGPARDVIRTYLQSGLGTTAERRWDSFADAPGDDVARMKAVRVLDSQGHVSEQIDIHLPMEVEVEFWLRGQTSPDPVPAVILEFWNQDDVMLFASTNLTEARPDDVGGTSVVRTRCGVPADLFAEGEVYVKVMVMSGSKKFHTGETDVVAFHVTDRTGGSGVRGELGGEWPGVVRPRLAWSTGVEREREEEEAPRGSSS
jgi:lipopolysaccharide transport system ATP-binding protein